MPLQGQPPLAIPRCNGRFPRLQFERRQQGEQGLLHRLGRIIIIPMTHQLWLRQSAMHLLHPKSAQAAHLHPQRHSVVCPGWPVTLLKELHRPQLPQARCPSSRRSSRQLQGSVPVERGVLKPPGRKHQRMRTLKHRPQPQSDIQQPAQGATYRSVQTQGSQTLVWQPVWTPGNIRWAASLARGCLNQ